MKIAELLVKCAKCGESHNLTNSVEYETYTHGRSFGDETEHIFNINNKCKCGQYIDLQYCYWEYPTGFINHSDKRVRNCRIKSMVLDHDLTVVE
jgi:hypothetical protein